MEKETICVVSDDEHATEEFKEFAARFGFSFRPASEAPRGSWFGSVMRSFVEIPVITCTVLSFNGRTVRFIKTDFVRRLRSNPLSLFEAKWWLERHGVRAT